ncbi:MAG: tetratricopeptide repeat protein [Verrucomicrobia bacterium]|nr:tetratricopeptide repeat protein [Verrucomicrobiota bacterium]
MSWVRVIICAGLLLLAGSGRIHAALGEERAFGKAETSFGLKLWENADAEFGKFIENYPKSQRLVEAVLLQAQARFKLKKFPVVISLLAARRGEAGTRADEFQYWTAEAQFQDGQFKSAAESFGRLAQEFPASPKRLEASVGEAASRAKLGDWKTAAELLRKPDGTFRQAAGAGDSDMFVRGLLLLAEAGIALGTFADAETALNEIGTRSLSPIQDWQRRYQLCRAQLGLNRVDEAQRGSTNLPSLAFTAGRPDLAAESVALGAEILEKLGRRAEAASLLGQNLTNNISVEGQRLALEKIAALYVADGKPAEACVALEEYLVRFTNSPAADEALLKLGELYLKRHVSGEGSNLLARATTNLDRCVSGFPNSKLRGRAELNRGWCFWISAAMAEGATAFAHAAEMLPSSENLAVARFKLADCLYAQTNYSGALENYRAALTEAALWPRARESLTATALYQSVRAALALTNLTAATDAMRKILETNPRSPEADRSVLLVTQGLVTSGDSGAAGGLFREFVERFPDSELRPQMELVMARAAEKAGDWAAAQSAYGLWLERFGTNAMRAEVEFRQALALVRLGNETNAFNLLTNLAATFPTNEFAPQAQWWVADYYYRQGDAQLIKAEQDYKLLYQKWPDSDLALQALMMAGRTAMLRLDSLNAMEHFTNLISNAKCKDELRMQALAAYGGALIKQAAVETNRLAVLELVIGVFKQIREEKPNTEWEAQAWGETGSCYLQMAARDAGYYSNALQAFQTALDLPAAGISARSRCRVGMAQVLELMSALPTTSDQVSLLKAAREQYAKVIDENRAAGEARDLFWLRKACLEGGRLSYEQLFDWGAAGRFYELLCEAYPPLRATYQRRIDHARAQEAQEKLQSQK